jgi:glyoxylase-like metal-dependent hydrolase (beta-lactamase superfamily II)/rhodanese-related sulfurtransferase
MTSFTDAYDEDHNRAWWPVVVFCRPLATDQWSLETYNPAMFFKQFYLGCLAHASYLIGSQGEAAIVDPQRDVDQYIEEANRLGLKIRYVLETHLHADFVSGHRELAARTGAEIAFGARANAEFPHLPIREGDELTVGGVTLKAFETPGHTPESISWLVTSQGHTPRVLTGDTLFIGDVGRPDLIGSKGFTPQAMAGMLYDSLHEKLLTLGDEVEVYPAHGAGSACGRNISKDTSSTIGEQRRMNYALQPMSKDDFIAMMTSDLPEAPAYFPTDAEINRRGARPLSELSAPRLSPAEVRERLDHGAIPLDVRDATAFAAGHLPGAIHISLQGQFASWAGTLLSPESALIIVAEGEEEADQALMRLARVGFENIDGILAGGIGAWNADGLALAELHQMTVDELRGGSSRPVLDVRRPAEFQSGHVPGAINIPLHELPKRIGELARRDGLAVICESGYRSSIAASLLQREGFHALSNIVGGTAAWLRSGYDAA